MNEKQIRKLAQFGIAYGILYWVYRKYGFERAVLVGLAMNSADLNETREKLANILYG